MRHGEGYTFEKHHGKLLSITNNFLEDLNRFFNGRLVFLRVWGKVAGVTTQEIKLTEEKVVFARKKALSHLKTEAGAFFDTVGFSIAWLER